ncbi:MAG: peptidoglycan DD-metalloendopeptidase family protein [Clostridia bacterium]|nr:peptidoglycan DD-metalloendopeptidase family protein [Clostridia bacterium]
MTREVQLIESVNGEQTASTTLEKQVVSSPVTEVVTVGTAASSSSNAAASAAGFICPISKGQYKVVAYWGDGRNHKAIDLAANKGVAIFAAAAGTVESAGYKSDYGYNVVINHGNGIKTRYAHASALCVKAGQTVTQGQMIAAVGSTGYSTGNHLHFEVIVNGTRVNPAPYINLG